MTDWKINDPNDPLEQLSADEQAAIAALRADYERLCDEAPVPTPGLVWWRASIRARAEAAETVEKPLTLAHGIAGACIAGVACALAGLVWRLMPAAPESIASLGALSNPLLIAALVAAICVVMAPLALILAFGRE